MLATAPGFSRSPARIAPGSRARRVLPPPHAYRGARGQGDLTQRIRRRIDCGFYDRDPVLKVVIERLASDLFD